MKTLIISPHHDDEVLGCFSFSSNGTVFFAEDMFPTNKMYLFKMDLITAIENQINHWKPDIILIPNPSYNQDHQTVYEACMVALRPHDINYFVPKVLMYEVYDYTNWGENQMIMNFFQEVDVGEKIKAYKKMKDKVRSYRSPKDLKRWAETIGKKCNMEYAEGFKCLRFS